MKSKELKKCEKMYTSPVVKKVAVKVEKGFAVSISIDEADQTVVMPTWKINKI